MEFDARHAYPNYKNKRRGYIHPRFNTLKPDDWLLLENSVEVQKNFHEVTQETSSEKSVSISKVLSISV